MNTTKTCENCFFGALQFIGCGDENFATKNCTYHFVALLFFEIEITQSKRECAFSSSSTNIDCIKAVSRNSVQTPALNKCYKKG